MVQDNKTLFCKEPVFFGYHKKNKDFIKIFLTDELSDFFNVTYESDKELRESLIRHSENPKNNLKDWPRVWISTNIGNYKLTRPGANNMWSLVARNLPPAPGKRRLCLENESSRHRIQ